MVNYRRSRVAGGSYFFTVNLRNRQSNILSEHIDSLRESFRDVAKKYPYTTEAIVVLPEHVHTIWSLPMGDDNYSVRWQLLKSLFTRKLIKTGIHLIKNKMGEYDLWQRRYWEHVIRDENDLHRHIEYIHYNSVKHGLVEHVKDWPYSSFHKYVKSGLVDLNWGVDSSDNNEQGYGERTLSIQKPMV